MIASEAAMFPRLEASELEQLRRLAQTRPFAAGDLLFAAGQAEIDFHVVVAGQVEVINPVDGDRVVARHGPGEFVGDIDLLTGRPVIVLARSRGDSETLVVPHAEFRGLLNRLPSLGEKLMAAFTLRREILAESGALGLRVVGSSQCPDTNLVREFLHKNFVPFVWYDPETPAGQQVFAELGAPRKTPAIQCGDGQVLLNPSLRDLAKSAGVWKHCPEQEVDLTIVGAGPAGITTAVYAASEGLRTLLLDRLGPGGQAGGSSRIENFIGFPAGLSGADLAMRGVLQLLKFGAQIVTPVSVDRILPADSPAERHVLELDCGQKIHSRVVLLAAGVRWRRLEAPGASRFERTGVFYACTTVEAHLFDKQDVAVVGAGNSAGQAVMFLAECCRTRTVHMLVRRTLGPGMSSYLAQRIRGAANVVVHEYTEIAEVRGGDHVETIVAEHNQTHERSDMPVGAVFVFIGAEPACDWLPAQLARDGLGYVLTGVDVVKAGRWLRTDRDPCPLETSLPGILAAGDIRAGSTKRVGFAVGDGSLAVTCAHRLLSLGS
ncbi:MAG: FAD-dependent oxidoreductase [Pirellulales bacterium]